MPGSAKSVDWDLSQDRHIRQVGWPADNPLKDTYHIGIAGFRHPRKIRVRLKITDTLVYEAEQVANVYVDKKDRDAPDLVTSIFVVERPASLADARIRFEYLRQALDMPPADLDAWQRKGGKRGQTPF